MIRVCMIAGGFVLVILGSAYDTGWIVIPGIVLLLVGFLAVLLPMGDVY